MPYDEDTKVFDVAKPSQAQPDATARPVIVGHRPQMSDPMVKESSSSAGTPIRVSMDDEEPFNLTNHPPDENPNPAPIPTQPAEHPEVLPFALEPNEENNDPAEEKEESKKEPEEREEHESELPAESEPEEGSPQEETSHFTPLNKLIGPEADEPEHYEPGEHHEPTSSQDGSWQEAPPLPITRGAGPRRRWPKILAWTLIILLVVLAIAYLAVDDGLVQSNIKLPFHIFNKQKTSSITTSPAAPPAVSNVSPAPTSAVPSGFTAYKVVGAGITFAYPTAWGTPTATTDPGFSKRGGANKSDGTYAYLVNFATNKDVQLAFTSSKDLPGSRPPLYYDFLQWCTGTNDGQIYKQRMLVNSANGTDAPGTVTCDQGPLTDATKIDNLTIAQLKTHDAVSSPGAAQAVAYDLYTENLTSADWPVLHVKDSAMKSSDDTKKLLTTVQVNSSPSNSSNNNSSNTSP